MSLCSPSSISFPGIPGLQHVHTTAESLTGWAPDSPQFQLFAPAPGDFTGCNVTVTYTHTGFDERIVVQAFLPEREAWNGQLTGLGGGGFKMGGFDNDHMAYHAMNGYAIVTSDGGHYDAVWGASADYMLQGEGSLDYSVLMNFARRAPGEALQVGKSIVKSYFGQAAEHTYFTGCSTGGRQAVGLAQFYPGEVDGIVSGCPAVFKEEVPAFLWSQQIMNEKGIYPHGCELNGIRDLAVEACDELDGKKDGILSLPDECTYEASLALGQSATCEDGSERTITQDAVTLMEHFWSPPTDDEGFAIAPAMTRGVRPSTLLGLANTECDEEGNNCRGIPFAPLTSFMKTLVKKQSADLDFPSMTRKEWADTIDAGIKEYGGGMLGAHADLKRFRKNGGKIIMWHGMNDQVLPYAHSRRYFERVREVDGRRGIDTEGYMRYFEVPGANHCSAGTGMSFPLKALDVIRAWVEDGKAPDRLPTVQAVVPLKDSFEACRYPLSMVWSQEKDDYVCEDRQANLGRASSSVHDEL